MQQQQFTKPFYIFLLVLPSFISFGFVSVTLPYLLRQDGFTVIDITGIVGIGLSANIFRFVWGPLADLTLSLRRWYWIGVAACIATLLLLCFIPFTPKESGLLIALVFISQIAGTFVTLPIGGFMANRIKEHHKGRASGWYQAGNAAGAGLGGGAGLWLATHYNIVIADIGLCIACLLSALVVMLIKDVQHDKGKSFGKEIATMGKDLLTMLKIPIVLFVIILLLLPIGTGAATNVWSAIADDWKTNADTVALITGALSGVVGGVASIIGGFVIDRWGNWVGYLGSGILCAIVTLIMAFMPYQPYVYIVGVLMYAFALGLVNAAFSSVILYAIGEKNASTKYALLSSLGNVPVWYMTIFDGWAHDKHNSKYMLVAEAVVGIIFVFICTVVLRQMRAKKLIPETID